MAQAGTEKKKKNTEEDKAQIWTVIKRYTGTSGA
jgi:hypothetical protein